MPWPKRNATEVSEACLHAWTLCPGGHNRIGAPAPTAGRAGRGIVRAESALLPVRSLARCSCSELSAGVVGETPAACAAHGGGARDTWVPSPVFLGKVSGRRQRPIGKKSLPTQLGQSYFRAEP